MTAADAGRSTAQRRLINVQHRPLAPSVQMQFNVVKLLEGKSMSNRDETDAFLKIVKICREKLQITVELLRLTAFSTR